MGVAVALGLARPVVILLAVAQRKTCQGGLASEAESLVHADSVSQAVVLLHPAGGAHPGS